MATLSIQTKISIDDFVEAAEQLPLAELDKLPRRLLHVQARRKTSNVSQREAEILEQISQLNIFKELPRLLTLTAEMKRRSLTSEEQDELHCLTDASEDRTAKRLALLIELSHLRGVTLAAVMKQLKIKAPGIV